MSSKSAGVAGCRIGNSKYGREELRLEIVEPATGDLLGTVFGGGGREATNGVTASSEALGEWGQVGNAGRALVLRSIAAALRETATLSELALLVSRETGKLLVEARAEVLFAAAFFDWFADCAATDHGEYWQMQGRQVVVDWRPVGVVGIVTPWNFPVSIPARKIAAVLAAGCTAVLKPSEMAPLSALLFADIVGSRLPPSVLNTVVGDPEAIVHVLTTDMRVRAISFTGSTPVGLVVAQKCAPQLKRLVLELGGRSPFIVCEGADLEETVSVLVTAKYRNNGESCIAANNVFVPSTVYEEFLRLYTQATAGLEIGDPQVPRVRLGPMVSKAHGDRIRSLVERARSDGEVIWSGPNQGMGPAFVAPAIVQPRASSEMWGEEVFGPITMVRSYTSIDAVITEVNSWDYGLAGYVCGPSAYASAVGHRLELGIIGVNVGAPVVPEAPFGGLKMSGMGREGSVIGLREFQEPRTIGTLTRADYTKRMEVGA